MIARETDKVGEERNWQGALKPFLVFGLLPILLVALFFFFGLYEPKFFRTANLINVLRNSSYLMIIASGQMLVLIIGGFDLSVGAVAALTSVVAALTMTSVVAVMPESVYLVIGIGVAAGLVVGSSVGVVNGAVVSVLKVSPLLVTLGTWSVVYGVALYMTSGIPIYGMPSEFTRDFGRLKLFDLPISLYITAFVLVTLWWIMNWMRLGRYIYAIGGNIHAARVSGIRTTTSLMITYTMCAFLAAVTGVLLTARVGSGEATMGTTFMLESIAAAVIGGVSLRGGVGRVELVALGALFLSLVSNGMNLIQVDSKIQTIVVGIVVILAVAIDQLGTRRVRR